MRRSGRAEELPTQKGWRQARDGMGVFASPQQLFSPAAITSKHQIAPRIGFNVLH